MQRCKTHFEQLLAVNHYQTTGLLSKLYQILIGYDSYSTTLYQKQWNNDCTRVIEDSEWHRMWSTSPFRSPVTAIQLQTIKIFIKWYYTLVKLYTTNPLVIPQYSKKNGQLADFVNNWRKCKVINMFWKQILTEIKIITGLDALFSIECVLLNIWKHLRKDPASEELAMFLVTIATIATNWSETIALTISVWEKTYL